MARNKSATNDDGNEKVGEIVASYVYLGQLMRVVRRVDGVECR